MTDNIVNLGAARTNKSKDSADWTPVDALKEVIRQIETKEVNAKSVMILVANETDPDGSWSLESTLSRVTREGAILQLEVARLDFMREMGHLK